MTWYLPIVVGESGTAPESGGGTPLMQLRHAPGAQTGRGAHPGLSGRASPGRHFRATWTTSRRGGGSSSARPIRSKAARGQAQGAGASPNAAAFARMRSSSDSSVSAPSAWRNSIAAAR